MSTTESRIETFVARYSEDIAAQLRDARSRLRNHFPRGHELVFDNYNALVFGISPTARSADAFISLAGYPRWVTLFFLHGTALDDPHGLLEGSGKQVRSIRLEKSTDLDKPQVRALIRQAIRSQADALHAAPLLATRIVTEVSKRRARRPSTATRTRSSSRVARG